MIAFQTLDPYHPSIQKIICVLEDCYNEDYLISF